MQKNLLEILSDHINKTTIQTIELQNNYSEYIFLLMKNLNSPLEINIDDVYFDGEKYVLRQLKKIYMKNEEIYCVEENDHEFKWGELSILSMDVIVNKIHIELLTEVNIKNISNDNP